MWTVTSLSLRARSHALESSTQGLHEDLALDGDGEELVNMLRCVDWSEDPVQVVVCDACGYPGCATGNRVAVRRAADHVVLAPSTRAYPPALGRGMAALRSTAAPLPSAGGDEPAAPEYVEPRWLRRRGAPIIPVAEWERLRDEGAPLPAADGMRPLRWGEAVLIAQLEAPRRMLGEPGEPAGLRTRDALAATDPWLDAATLERLADVGGWADPAAPAELSVAQAAEPVSLILSDPLEEVVLFGRRGDALGLHLQPGLLLLPSVL